MAIFSYNVRYNGIGESYNFAEEIAAALDNIRTGNGMQLEKIISADYYAMYSAQGEKGAIFIGVRGLPGTINKKRASIEFQGAEGDITKIKSGLLEKIKSLELE